MATLQSRVENYVGEVTNSSILTTFLTTGAQRLVDLLPMEEARKHAVPVSAPDGSDASGKLVAVTVDGFPARESRYEMAGLHGDSTSLHYVNSARDGVYYIRNNAIYHLPAAGTCVLFNVPYPLVNWDDTMIATFPPIWEEPVILYAAVQYKHLQMDEERVAMAAAIPTLDLTSDYTALNTALVTEQDVELAQGHLGRIQIKIAEYNAKLAGVAATLQQSTQKISALGASMAALQQQYLDSLTSLFGVKNAAT